MDAGSINEICGKVFVLTMKGLAAILLIILVCGHIAVLFKEIKRWKTIDWGDEWMEVLYIVASNIAIVLTALFYFGIISTEQ